MAVAVIFTLHIDGFHLFGKRNAPRAVFLPVKHHQHRGAGFQVILVLTLQIVQRYGDDQLVRIVVVHIVRSQMDHRGIACSGAGLVPVLLNVIRRFSEILRQFQGIADIQDRAGLPSVAAVQLCAVCFQQLHVLIRGIIEDYGFLAVAVKVTGCNGAVTLILLIVQLAQEVEVISAFLRRYAVPASRKTVFRTRVGNIQFGAVPMVAVEAVICGITGPPVSVMVKRRTADVPHGLAALGKRFRAGFGKRCRAPAFCLACRYGKVAAHRTAVDIIRHTALLAAFGHEDIQLTDRVKVDPAIHSLPAIWVFPIIFIKALRNLVIETERLADRPCCRRTGDQALQARHKPQQHTPGQHT